MRRSWLAPVAALVVIGGGIAASEVTAPPPRRSPPAVSTAALVSAIRICPQVRNIADVVGTRVSTAATGLPGAPGGTGTLTVAQVGAGPTVTTPLTRPGTVLGGLPGEVHVGGAQLVGSGALAAGLTAEQVTRGTVGLERGIAAVRCTPPSGDAWYVGAATTLNVDSRLVLINPDPTAAAADVGLIGATGVLNVPDALGIAVPPNGRIIVRLSDLAPDQAQLVVHVQASTGRLVSAIEQIRGTARTPRGVDWLPDAGPPARALVIPGVPAGRGARTLLVTNTADAATTFSVRFTTGQGQFVPTGMDTLALSAHASRSVDLTKAMAGGSAAVRVTSEGADLVAAVYIDATAAGDPLSDFAWAGPTPPLSGVALLPEVATSAVSDETLYLTAPKAAASVTVAPLPVLGVSAAAAPAQVSVPAGRSVAVSLRNVGGKATRDPVRVVVATPDVPVYAGRYLFERASRGPLASWLPAMTEPTTVSIPPVRNDQLAGTSAR